MAETKGRHLLTEKDFVEVVDEAGNDLPAVPKHWDADQLPPGAKKKSSGAKKAKGSAPDPDAEPSGNASREDWVAYATKVKGAKDEDLVDEQGEPLGRDELRAKFGSPAE